MKSFAEFITEVVRSDERAFKLDANLAKRTAKYKPHPMDDGSSRVVRLKIEHSKMGPFQKEANRHLKLHKSFRNMFSKTHHTVERVPVKSLVNTQSFSLHGKEHFDRKVADRGTPLNVMKFKDEHYIIDGHHRAHHAKLKGDTHVNARVYDMDKYSDQLPHESFSKKKRR